MSEEGNNEKHKLSYFLGLLVLVIIQIVIFVCFFYVFGFVNGQKALLAFFVLPVLLIVLYYSEMILSLIGASECFNRAKLQCIVLAAIEFLELLVILVLFISGKSGGSVWIVIAFVLILFILLIFLILTGFFYAEPECWRKRISVYFRESIKYSIFPSVLLWFIAFLILFIFISSIVLLIMFNFDVSTIYKLYKFLVDIIKNNNLFELTFDLFLFTFFAFIIFVLGKFFDKTKGTEDSEFLFYMLSIRALIIWDLALIIAYSLIRTIVLESSSNNLNNNLVLVLFFYAFSILVFYYFIEKFFEVINFAKPAHRLQMKIKVLSRSPLSRNTLRLWNIFWKNEKFGNSWKEAIFLSYFVPRIVYHKEFFQLEEEVSVTADVLSDFSDNIDKRYSEALAREVLSITPRQYTRPKRLPEYLVDALNAYKDIVCNDKLVCEDLYSSAFLHNRFFGEEAEKYMSKYKYQYLDGLIYQILYTLRKSIRKLRNDGYFKEHGESRKILWEKFNKFVDTLGNLECVSNKGKKRLRDALKTESAKKWIKEAGNLLEEVADNNKDINVNNNRSTLTPNFTKSVQALKEGNIDTDALEKVLEKWTEICK